MGKGTTVMDIKNRPKDASVLKVLKTLKEGYQPNHPKAAIEAYRYNSASIRIRIIDPDFEGLDLVERDEMLRPLLRTLPEEVGADITLLILITPKERKRSPGSVEFDYPSPALADL
jgi:stress-induced morphogen